MSQHSFMIDGRPLDPSYDKKWPPRENGVFPDKQDVVVPIISVKECGLVKFWDLREYNQIYSPVTESTTPEPEIIKCSNLEGLITAYGEAVVAGDATLFFDLGRVIKGTFEIEAVVPAGAAIMFGIGEAKEPLRTYPSNEIPDGTCKVYRPDIGVTQSFSYTGLRYVWVKIENLAAPAKIKTAHGILQVYPCSNVGSFECSDEMLNKIWEMCTYSAKLCMEPHFPRPDKTVLDGKPHCATTALIFDRIDRFAWAGDSRIIADVLFNAFGEFDFVKDLLDFFIPKEVNKSDDPCWFPKTCHCVVDLPPYLLDWILMVLRYVEVSGDRQELENRVGLILLTLEKWWSSHIPGGFYFFDWDPRIMDRAEGCGSDEPIMTEAWPAFVFKYIQAARETVRLCEIMGLNDAAGKARKFAEGRAAAVERLYPDWTEKFDIHAITNGILADIGKPEDYIKAFERVYADKDYRCTGTPYFGYYVLLALAKLDKHGEAIEMLKMYWGKMIELGATTVWEEFEHTWELQPDQQPPQPYGWGCNSLCQPAGSGPVTWLMTEILGVKPSSPGFKTVKIEPHFADLKWAKGNVPTPLGSISVEWRFNETGILCLDVDMPSGMKAEIVLADSKVIKLNDLEQTPVKQGDSFYMIKIGSE